MCGLITGAHIQACTANENGISWLITGNASHRKLAAGVSLH
ncbi:MAG: hypothetical protein V3U57_09430 [Robiginitomaculum sp.]